MDVKHKSFQFYWRWTLVRTYPLMYSITRWTVESFKIFSKPNNFAFILPKNLFTTRILFSLCCTFHLIFWTPLSHSYKQIWIHQKKSLYINRQSHWNQSRLQQKISFHFITFLQPKTTPVLDLWTVAEFFPVYHQKHCSEQDPLIVRS